MTFLGYVYTALHALAVPEVVWVPAAAWPQLLGCKWVSRELTGVCLPRDCRRRIPSISP